MRNIRFWHCEGSMLQSNEKLFQSKGDFSLKVRTSNYSFPCHRSVLERFSWKVRNLDADLNAMALDCDVSQKALCSILRLLYYGVEKLAGVHVVTLLHAGHALGLQFAYDNSSQSFELLAHSDMSHETVSSDMREKHFAYTLLNREEQLETCSPPLTVEEAIKLFETSL